MDPREARNLIPITHQSSGIVSFQKPGASAQEVLRDLNSARFYNTYEEVERVLEVLAPESVTR